MDFTASAPREEQSLLAALGLAEPSLLFSHIPEEIRLRDRTLLAPLGPGLSEAETGAELARLAGANRPLACFAGYGSYDHYVPAAVWQLAGRGDFLTAYTPYQPEASQGTLRAIHEYQSALCRLYGMEVANASVYDGATAVAEAALMACRVTGRERIFVSAGLHPHYREVLATFAAGLGLEVDELPLVDGVTDFSVATGEAAAVIQASPNFLGCLEDWAAGRAAADRVQGLFVAVPNAVASAIMAPPGEAGADIVAAEGQPLGLGLNWGGAAVGHFATRMAHIRQMPGRVCGKTVDRLGRDAWCLTFQTREQHIKREKATSNICSNQNLFALANLVHLCLLGDAGLAEVARLAHGRALALADGITRLPGFALAFARPFFHEFLYLPPAGPQAALERLAAAGILGGVAVAKEVSGAARDGILVACTEQRTEAEIAAYLAALGKV